MPRAAARPPDQPGRFWDPRQSHVADETGQSENSPTGHERSWRFFVVALESSDLRAPSAWPIVRHRDEFWIPYTGRSLMEGDTGEVHGCGFLD